MLKKIFSDESPLKKIIPDFKARASQQEMAAAVESALKNKKTLIVEAGTGTGKTFAYLIPALISNKKIVISTGTKNLQDQLFLRDLPLLKKALELSVNIALLKGRRNYLCHYRIEKFSQEGKFISREVAAQFNTIANNINQTQYGEITEFKDISEDSAVWPFVTSTNDNCLGQECPFIDKCFLVNARKKALKADVLVINHHLFFADLTLRETGFGELLPNAEAIIFDEAHQLAETAINFFGSAISSRQLLELVKDTEKEALALAADSANLFQICTQLQKAVADMRLCFPMELVRKPWYELAHKTSLQRQISEVQQLLAQLQKILEINAPRSKGLENCWQRSIDLNVRFQLLTTTQVADQIHWYETHSQSFTIHLTPLNIAAEFQKQMQNLSNTHIFTSATLAIKEDFSFFAHQIGLTEADCFRLESSYDFKKVTKLYIPSNIPDPSADDYLAKIVAAAIPVINAAKGRTFFLFTSHSALKQAAALLANKILYPILLQGQMPKTELLEKFRASGNAVLLATSSFWEGVDVKGEALSCVIIDKLPFAAPSDPILKAQIAALREQGRDPFHELQLNHAVISLKQGVGRLIRDETDRGILMICDPRILNKAYGKIFLASLPTIPITRSLTEVEDFFKQGN